ncbi:MAG: hypothetical protein KME46_02180 [Brasilonema angustatum HA4187-MV1]|jgi:hypothetical protein|nr:hypothetical protein [Brasilonema angustatum HA4187-MV1]
MDKVSLYRQYIQELLSQRAKLRCSGGAATLTPNDPIESETIFDTTSDCAKRRRQRRTLSACECRLEK